MSGKGMQKCQIYLIFQISPYTGASLVILFAKRQNLCNFAIPKPLFLWTTTDYAEWAWL